jgi:hypothetical protein
MKEDILALSIVSAGYTEEDQGEEHYEDIKLEVSDALFSRCFGVVFSMDAKIKALEVRKLQLYSHRHNFKLHISLNTLYMHTSVFALLHTN